jgi:hypothetical protein
MSSTLLKLLLTLTLAIVYVNAYAHLTEDELRKGINVAMTWKKLSFEQRKEIILNLLSMPNFNLKLENQLMKAITGNQVLDKEERKQLVKLIMLKEKQEFHEG